MKNLKRDFRSEMCWGICLKRVEETYNHLMREREREVEVTVVEEREPKR